MAYAVNINVRITITPSHQFLNYIGEFPIIELGLGFLPIVHFPDTYTSTTTDRLHKNGKIHFTLLQSVFQPFK